MMKIIISWDKIDIIEIIRKEKKYYSVILPENTTQAIEQGMPMVSIANINLVSKRMPKFILERIPEKNIRDKYLDKVSNDEGENIINYINKTNCECATDKFKIRIEQ